MTLKCTINELQSAMNTNTASYWESYLTQQADYLIVGAGIVGLTCAIELKKHQPKARVLILERGPWPSGASIKNAGFACFGSVSEIVADAAHHTEQELIALIRKRARGLEQLKAIVGSSTMNFQQVGGYEYFLHTQAELYEGCLDRLKWADDLAKEALETTETIFSTVNNEFGFTQVMDKGILNHHEGHIHTGRLMEALVKEASSKGVLFYGGVEVASHEEHKNQVFLNTNKHGFFKTRKLLLATNGYTSKLLDNLVEPARAQVLITRPIPGLKLKGTFHLDQGYYYFREIDQRILLGGGRNLDFDSERTTEERTTKSIQEALERLLREVILPHTSVEVDQSWAGIMGIGDKKSPMIKALSPNVHCGVRLGGMGVALGAGVGSSLAELAMKA